MRKQAKSKKIIIIKCLIHNQAFILSPKKKKRVP